MPYLIDGDNLLGTWRERKRSDAGRRELSFELQRLARRLGRRVVVVFDGDPPPGQQLGGEVHFSGAGHRADDVILSLLRREPDRKGWCVVTSDRALADQCRWLEARAERADTFRKCLAGTTGAEKPDREENVEEWLAVFGGDEPTSG